MKPYTVLILDDEPCARLDLKDRLHHHNPAWVLHEAGSVDAAAAILSREPVDALFLDIQLMGETGFDLLARHPITASVVFVTAYDEFALKAFDLNARDYLLKPFSQERFEQTMARLAGATRPSPPPQQLSLADHLIEQTGSGLKIIPLSEVVFISAEDDYTRVHTVSGDAHLVSRRMNEWQRILPEPFKRVHRSFLVNFQHASAILPHHQGVCTVQLKGRTERIPISRERLKTLRLQKT